jgi:hypothetical protein
MSVYWYCDRCNKKETDKGVRVSNIPEGWRAFYLAEAKEDRLTPYIETLNLCEHCSNVAESNAPKIQFERVRNEPRGI